VPASTMTLPMRSPEDFVTNSSSWATSLVSRVSMSPVRRWSWKASESRCRCACSPIRRCMPSRQPPLARNTSASESAALLTIASTRIPAVSRATVSTSGETIVCMPDAAARSGRSPFKKSIR
jgi:hypothetical protein